MNKAGITVSNLCSVHQPFIFSLQSNLIKVLNNFFGSKSDFRSGSLKREQQFPSLKEVHQGFLTEIGFQGKYQQPPRNKGKMTNFLIYPTQ